MDTASEKMTENGYGTMSANDLLAGMGRSDIAALAELYDRTSALAYRVAHGLTGDSARAAAAVEAAYMDAWRTGRVGENVSSVAGWILDLVERRARAVA